jgi:TetR/AcrR family transcriptional regulator, regulator of mycofactocin system
MVIPTAAMRTTLAVSSLGAGHPGRRRVTSHAELEQAAFALFAAHGFDATTVDEIAAAAGIGRRTFFRYFPSKNDIPWGAFEQELERMRVRLKACPPEVPLMDAIRLALIDFNRVAPAQVPLHRRRMELILRVPTLLAHSTLRFTAWREVVAEFVAERTSCRPDDLAPQAIARHPPRRRHAPARRRIRRRPRLTTARKIKVTVIPNGCG